MPFRHPVNFLRVFCYAQFEVKIELKFLRVTFLIFCRHFVELRWCEGVSLVAMEFVIVDLVI